MFLDLKQIDKHPGAELKRSGVCDFSAEVVDGIFPLPQPVKVETAAVNKTGLIHVIITASYDITSVCDRCATEYTRHYEPVFEHIVKSGYATGEDLVEADDNGRLLIDDLLWEDIMLALPPRNLCENECKGLCMTCGGNLNEHACICGQKKQVNTD